MVGYKTGARAYCLWDPVSKRITVSRNIIFNERLFSFLNPEKEANTPFELDEIFTFPNTDMCPHVIPDKNTNNNHDTCHDLSMSKVIQFLEIVSEVDWTGLKRING